ncbi:ComEA family DNA-binding protein [Actinokineospora pegani]|uniref:ComEA family DNA-binding protein n=1 Tax=Actinokineospora pegani TaxID=2654637 RepID=UPI0012EA6B31|nr:ComEA family DNA-binding protein [Actinokineospora pegani]
MTDTTTRTSRVDSALARLAAVVGRPWDRPDQDYVVDDEDTEPERPVRWWQDHPAGSALRRALPRRRAPVVLGVAGLGAVALVAHFALSGEPVPESPPDLAAATIEQSTHPPSPSATSTVLIVDVVGKVAAPGVRTLPGGSRVRDALTAAGGALPDADLTILNLARPLVDGEQVRVGLPAPPDAAAPGPAGAAPTGPVDLNTATTHQLDALPGVGAVTAQRIIAWRDKHGRFRDVEQLQDVDGIGPARYESLRELVVAR